MKFIFLLAVVFCSGHRRKKTEIASLYKKIENANLFFKLLKLDETIYGYSGGVEYYTEALEEFKIISQIINKSLKRYSELEEIQSLLPEYAEQDLKIFKRHQEEIVDHEIDPLRVSGNILEHQKRFISFVILKITSQLQFLLEIPHRIVSAEIVVDELCKAKDGLEKIKIFILKEKLWINPHSCQEMIIASSQIRLIKDNLRCRLKELPRRPLSPIMEETQYY